MKRNNDKKKPQEPKVPQAEGLNKISPRNVKILGMAGYLLVTGPFQQSQEDLN